MLKQFIFASFFFSLLMLGTSAGFATKNIGMSMTDAPLTVAIPKTVADPKTGEPVTVTMVVTSSPEGAFIKTYQTEKK